MTDSEENWIKNIDKNYKDPFTQYVYSLYFAGATLFTVGYGDITPQNNLEMIVILVIQALGKLFFNLGIVLIGYIINEIGHTLSSMRQARDDFEEDIQNADIICNNYQLNKELKHKVRNYIVNNRLANDELNVAEENSVLMKLNEELRSGKK